MVERDPVLIFLVLDGLTLGFVPGLPDVEIPRKSSSSPALETRLPSPPHPTRARAPHWRKPAHSHRVSVTLVSRSEHKLWVSSLSLTLSWK